jgi:hypothetical protein
MAEMPDKTPGRWEDNLIEGIRAVGEDWGAVAGIVRYRLLRAQWEVVTGIREALEVRLRRLPPPQDEIPKSDAAGPQPGALKSSVPHPRGTPDLYRRTPDGAEMD